MGRPTAGTQRSRVGEGFLESGEGRLALSPQAVQKGALPCPRFTCFRPLPSWAAMPGHCSVSLLVFSCQTTVRIITTITQT